MDREKRGVGVGCIGKEILLLRSRMTGGRMQPAVDCMPSMTDYMHSLANDYVPLCGLTIPQSALLTAPFTQGSLYEEGFERRAGDQWSPLQGGGWSGRT